ICWAIASTRSLSARLRILKKIEAPLSALHLLVGLIDKVNSKGALVDFQHLQTFLKKDGAILEEDCMCVEPLLNTKKGKTKSKVPTLCTNKRQPKRTFKVKDLIISEKVDEKKLISLVTEGPVAVSLDFYKEFEDLVGVGWNLLRSQKSRKQVEKNMVVCHGYGTVNGIHYWDIQNSAGTRWGNGGFGKVIR
ncbi:unnamed protein product, partial [Thlaspi arvense]